MQIDEQTEKIMLGSFNIEKELILDNFYQFKESWTSTVVQGPVPDQDLIRKFFLVGRTSELLDRSLSDLYKYYDRKDKNFI